MNAQTDRESSWSRYASGARVWANQSEALTFFLQK